MIECQLHCLAASGSFWLLKAHQTEKTPHDVSNVMW